MICPVEIAHEMSALRAARIEEHAKHGFLPEGRDGAGDESTGRNVAGGGQDDYLVAGSGNSVSQPRLFSAKEEFFARAQKNFPAVFANRAGPLPFAD